MRKQAVSQMQNEDEANVEAYLRIPNLLAESFVNKKLLRISEERFHIRPFFHDIRPVFKTLFTGDLPLFARGQC